MQEITGFFLLLLASFLGSLYAIVTKISVNRLLFYGALNFVTVIMACLALTVFGFPAQASLPYWFAGMIFFNTSVFFILKAYERLDISQLYALQVCVHLVVLTQLSIYAAHESLNAIETAALLLLLSGLIVQIPFKRMFEKSYRDGIIVCIVVGISSGLQTFMDTRGIKLSGNPFGYIAMTCLIGLPVTCVAFYKNRDGLLSLLHRERWHIVAGSFLDVAAYSLLLYVVYIMKVTYVLPASNTGVIFTTLIGLFILKEAQPKRRMVSAVIICAAAILMQMAH